MATRPVFTPGTAASDPVRRIAVDFQWYPGMAISRQKLNVHSLHRAAADEHNLQPLLEISSRSDDPKGVALSAFNLKLEPREIPGVNCGYFDSNHTPRFVSVESLFQSCKMFDDGGPYPELLSLTSREAKKFPGIRATEERPLRAFRLAGEDWPLEPQTLFYDWLYLNALRQNRDLAGSLTRHKGFTDIAFNPKKSINCQAASAALYCFLENEELLEEVLRSPEAFREFFTETNADRESEAEQLELGI